MTVDPLTGYSFDHRQMFVSQRPPAPDASFAAHYQAESGLQAEADEAEAAAVAEIQRLASNSPDEIQGLDRDEWRRQYNQALATNDYSTFMRLRNPDHPWQGLPGGEYAVSSPNRVTGEVVPTSDMVRYEEYYRRMHDQVVSELGLNVNRLSADSPETWDALKLIGEKIMADPEGRRHIVRLGLNHLNQAGLPTAPMPALDGKPATVPNPKFDDLCRAVRKEKEKELLDGPAMREVRLDRPPSSLPAKSLLGTRYAAH